MKTHYVPLSKRTKKEQREVHQEKRSLWPIPPVTKRIESKKLYNRKKRVSDQPWGPSETRFLFGRIAS